jgi:putative acetyltransferase
MVRAVTSLIIRRASVTDTDALDAVRTEVLRGIDRAVYSEDQIAAWIGDNSSAIIRESLAASSETTFLAVAGDQVVGYASLAFRTRPHLWALYVLPQYSRQGIASSLLEMIQSEVRAWGYRDLYAVASLCAEGFYRAHGFVGLASFLVTRRRPGGEGEIELRMIPMYKYV